MYYETILIHPDISLILRQSVLINTDTCISTTRNAQLGTARALGSLCAALLFFSSKFAKLKQAPRFQKFAYGAESAGASPQPPPQSLLFPISAKSAGRFSEHHSLRHRGRTVSRRPGRGRSVGAVLPDAAHLLGPIPPYPKAEGATDMAR